MNKVNAQPNTMARRSVLAAGAVGVGAAGLLAACGGDDEPAASTPEPSSTSAAPSGSEAPGAGALATTAEIPVGGGKIFTAQSVVVTQPAAGDFKAFSAKCTHQGCLVSQVQDGEIICTCHQSRFSASDGSVLGGPAPSALPAQTITVTGESITLG